MKIMLKHSSEFFVLFVLMIIYFGINCGNKNLRAGKPTESAKQLIGSDTIIDPIQLPICEITLKQKNIIISHRNGFSSGSIGNAVINVVISKLGKLESWKLIYLKITMEDREVYLLDQTRQNDNDCPKEIEYICNRLNEELQNATITCEKDNKKETRLRIPIKLKFE